MLAEHAPSGSFHSQEHLREAVDDARLRLADLQTATPFILQLDAAADASPGGGSGGDAVDGSAQPAAAGGGSGADPSAASPGAPVPTLPPSEEVELPPDELTEAQQQTLASMHTAAALEDLPSLWSVLIRQDTEGGAEASDAVSPPSLPLPLAVDAAFGLSDPDPWERVRYRVGLRCGAGGDRAAGERLAEEVSIDELRTAALHTVQATTPLLCTLLEQTEMLDETERKRLMSLKAVAPASTPPAAAGGGERSRWRRFRWLRARPVPASEVLTDELGRLSRMQRLGRLAFGRKWDREAAAAAAAEARPPLAVLAAGDGRHAALYDALHSSSSVHLGLTRALFSLHDRLSTRRRRQLNALKATGLFIGLNLLDFMICNL